MHILCYIPCGILHSSENDFHLYSIISVNLRNNIEWNKQVSENCIQNSLKKKTTSKTKKPYNTLLRDIHISDKIIFKKQGMTQTIQDSHSGDEHIQYWSFWFLDWVVYWLVLIVLFCFTTCIYVTLFCFLLFCYIYSDCIKYYIEEEKRFFKTIHILKSN